MDLVLGRQLGRGVRCTARVKHCLCLVFQLPSLLRQCLCHVIQLPSLLRHCLCPAVLRYMTTPAAVVACRNATVWPQMADHLRRSSVRERNTTFPCAPAAILPKTHAFPCGAADGQADRMAEGQGPRAQELGRDHGRARTLRPFGQVTMAKVPCPGSPCRWRRR